MTKETFDQLLRQHRDRVFTHALRCLRDRHDAEDVTQDAFLRLWRLDPDVPEDRMGAWLGRVVHNLCIDQVRRRTAMRSNLGRPDPDALGRLHARPAAEAQEPSLGEEMHAAMAALPPQTRSMMVMHYEQGMKLREIAEELGIGLPALKVRIHRARKTLRAVLERPEQAAAAASEENG